MNRDFIIAINIQILLSLYQNMIDMYSIARFRICSHDMAMW